MNNLQTDAELSAIKMATLKAEGAKLEAENRSLREQLQEARADCRALAKLLRKSLRGGIHPPEASEGLQSA